jgi:hypothetical protein
MDTAKFCGNCGNPFPRPSSPTSSLINCPQGHIYSAVYEHCPYCPQPGGDQDADFITRVEEPVTAIDAPSPFVPPARGDFVTRVEPNEAMFETSETPAVAAPASPEPSFSPTEVITSVSPLEVAGRSNVESFKAPEPVNDLGDDQLLEESSYPEMLQPSPPPPPPPQKQPGAFDSDRHTIVMAEQSSPLHRSKGRIVGWLITYSRNPDGEDFRVYAGYNRLGANPVCDIVLDDETVSGSHSIIVYRDGRCLIKDDLSRNGTFVNGREITESHPLQSYDQIRVGNTYLTFVAAQRTP